MEKSTTYRIGIIGVGPRGLSVLERIIENARDEIGNPITIELVDSHSFGAGEVWRTDQPSDLIMNIVASQITAFTDDTVEMAGPVREGPNLYEWARGVVSGRIRGNFSEEILDEAEQVDENSYCRRAFYGHYLEWVYTRLVKNLPGNIEIREHRRRANSVVNTVRGDQLIGLMDGTMIEVDDVVLAVGHGTVDLSSGEEAAENFAAATNGLYYPPANPADVSLEMIEPSRKVLIRGLGLCFFDYMALLTTGRGGRFVRTDQELSYVPSGREPHIVCGSRRGVPLHGRADNEKGDRRYEPRFLTADRIADLRSKEGNGNALNFRHDCWPLIAKEVETVYYTRLLANISSEEHSHEFRELYETVPWSSSSEREILRKFRIPEEDFWDWSRISQPWRHSDVESVDSWRSFIRSYLAADVREARRGNVSSALKAAVDVLRDIRNELRYVMNNGGVDGESYKSDVEGWFNSLHSFLSIGPPWNRIEEMVALSDAGVLEMTGPRFKVDLDRESGKFIGKSCVPGDEHESTTLIDAMLPSTDLNRTRNSVLANLHHGRQLTNFTVKSSASSDYMTGGIAVTERPFRVIRPDGSAHPNRYVFGVPTEGANWVTGTGIRPNVNSITLGDSDAIARSVLGLPTETCLPTGQWKQNT
ncbi:hypothetical protein CDG81_08535 [Actinopolyspora erythraea]|uniref:FAD-dependent urate hydroxylase HpyO/Asp monooxygenase CreE-like FAD/NAD(P)-binding domain-containing protein n=1 Tax=Actinopolyspora erythraea TaxID=414996 RepID=A0A223RR56_9ACTN|nr:FAD/NAD(P)-binding protein [Actinopolyspora erythraea]ASU78330.1 hypothetical protein CDG81_08535 [Actinopolyspora erythraea]